MNDQPVPDEATPRPIDARLRRHLQATARLVPAPSGNATRARRVARERTIRRRRVASGTVAAASVAAMVVSVQRLTVSAPTVRDAGVSTMPPASATGGPPRIVAAPAAVGAPGFVWNVVEPDQDRTITSTFDNGFSDRLATLAVSTAPGRSNDYDDIQPVVWRTSDGVNWERTGIRSPFTNGAMYESLAAAGNLFAVGTAPGVAAGESNPLSVAITDGSTDDWTVVPLPVDTHALPELPLAVSGLERTTYELDDGVLIGVTTTTSIDLESVAEANPERVDRDDRTAVGADGLEVPSDGCGADEWPTTTAVAGAGSSAGAGPSATSVPPRGTVVESADEGADGDGGDNGNDGGDGEVCAIEVITWAELGVPAETIDALGTHATMFFHVTTDGTVTPVESPVPGERMVSLLGTQNAVVVRAVGRDGNPTSSEAYRFDEGSWVRVTLPAVPWSSMPHRVEGATVGWLHDDDGDPVFARIADDGTTTASDLGALLPEHSMTSAERSLHAAGRFVSALSVTHDPMAAAGGIEIARDGYALRVDDSLHGSYVVDLASGERVPDDRIRHADDMEVIDDEGNVIVTFTYAELDAATEPLLPGRDPASWSLVTTADGVSFAVESVAELLGVDEDRVSRVARLATDGNQVVVTVTLTDRHADDSPKQLVLIGTPVD